MHSLHSGSLDAGNYLEKINWKAVSEAWNRANPETIMSDGQLRAKYYEMLKK